METFGDGAHGIYASNAGGAAGAGGGGSLTIGADGIGGAGKDITVNTSGDVLANGASAYGIYVESFGGSGASAGNLSVNVNTPPVVPFVAGNPLPSGPGRIRPRQRGACTSTAAWTTRSQTTARSPRWTASTGGRLVGTGGNETINNYGLLIGSVNLGSGANDFENNADARFESGAWVTLGNLGTGLGLHNFGMLAPGGDHAIMTTQPGW